VLRREWIVYFGLTAGSLMLSPLWTTLGLTVAHPAAFPIQFYQHIIGPLDGKTCPSWPACSLYARQAITRHGLLVGSWLALDRLIHEGDDLRHAMRVRVDGGIRSWDPLARNDFWLKE